MTVVSKTAAPVWLTHAHVIDVDNESIDVDVCIEDGFVVDIGRAPATFPSERTFALDGKRLIPGATCLQTHVQDPGAEDVESLAAVQSLAAHGGVTSFVGWPRKSHPIVDVEQYSARFERQHTRASSYFPMPQFTVDKGYTEHFSLKERGALVVGNGLMPESDLRTLLCAFEYAAGTNVPIIVAPLHPAFVDGVARESPFQSTLGLPTRPDVAECIVVETLLGLARHAGARVAIGPLSSRNAAARVIRAANDVVEGGGPGEILGFTTLSHMLLDENAHRVAPFSTELRHEPPLGTAADRAALSAFVDDGALAVSSGHAAVSQLGKSLDFRTAEPGVQTLPWFVPLILDGADGKNLRARICAISEMPARFLGRSGGRIRVGEVADLVALESTPRGAPWPLVAGANGNNRPTLFSKPSSRVAFCWHHGALVFPN